MNEFDNNTSSGRQNLETDNGLQEEHEKKTGYREAGNKWAFSSWQYICCKTADESSLLALCTVCSGPAATHIHYGAISCYSCR